MWIYSWNHFFFLISFRTTWSASATKPARRWALRIKSPCLATSAISITLTGATHIHTSTATGWKGDNCIEGQNNSLVTMFFWWWGDSYTSHPTTNNTEKKICTQFRHLNNTNRILQNQGKTRKLCSVNSKTRWSHMLDSGKGIVRCRPTPRLHTSPLRQRS